MKFKIINLFVIVIFTNYSFAKQYLEYQCNELVTYKAERTHSFYDGGGYVIYHNQPNYNKSGEPYISAMKNQCEMFEGERYISYVCPNEITETKTVTYKIDKSDMTLDVGKQTNCRKVGIYKKYTSTAFEDYIPFRGYYKED